MIDINELPELPPELENVSAGEAIKLAVGYLKAFEDGDAAQMDRIFVDPKGPAAVAGCSLIAHVLIHSIASMFGVTPSRIYEVLDRLADRKIELDRIRNSIEHEAQS